jgi:tetratricopeptide (TPR) repeat protein
MGLGYLGALIPYPMTTAARRLLPVLFLGLFLFLLSCGSRDLGMSSPGPPRMPPPPLEKISLLFQQAHATPTEAAPLRFARAHRACLFISTNAARPVLCCAAPFDTLKVLSGAREYLLPLATYSESSLHFNACYNGQAMGRVVFESEEPQIVGLDVEPPLAALFGGQTSFAFVSLSYSSRADSLATLASLRDASSAHPEAVAAVGLLLQHIDRHPEAIVLFTSYIERNPQDCQSYRSRGDSYWATGKHTLAKQDYLACQAAAKRNGKGCRLPDYARLLLNEL